MLLELAAALSSSRLVASGIGFRSESDGRARPNDGGLSVAAVRGPKSLEARSFAAPLRRADPQEELIVRSHSSGPAGVGKSVRAGM